MKPDDHKKKRQRTCYDRARKRWLEARRAQTHNPAASAALQLLGVFGLAFGRMLIAAPMPAPYVAPQMSPRQEQRNEAARRLGVPTRYLDIVLSQGIVPYSILSEHIRLGGATQRDALNELRKRIPAAALDWLDHIEKHELWSDLSRCFTRDTSEEAIDVHFLKAALAWVESQKKSDSNPLGPTVSEGDAQPRNGGNKDGVVVGSMTSRNP